MATVRTFNTAGPVVPADRRIERAYAPGRRRTDLLIVLPQGGRERRFVVECKVLRKDLERRAGRIPLRVTARRVPIKLDRALGADARAVLDR